MNVKLASAATVGISGLLTAGLLALPAVASDDLYKRDDQTAELLLVSDDDDNDDDDDDRRGDDDTQGQTRTRGDDTRQTNPDTNSRDGQTNSRTGDKSGTDRSREKSKVDWTRDGGTRTIDKSRNDTNDRSRHNTRG